MVIHGIGLTEVNLIEALSEESVGFILWGPRMSVPNLLSIHPLVSKIFQSGKWWIDGPTLPSLEPKINK